MIPIYTALVLPTYSSTATNGPGSLLPVTHRHPLVQIARQDTTGRPVTPAGSVRRPDSRLPRIRHLGKRNKDGITVLSSPMKAEFKEKESFCTLHVFYGFFFREQLS